MLSSLWHKVPQVDQIIPLIIKLSNLDFKSSQSHLCLIKLNRMLSRAKNPSLLKKSELIIGHELLYNSYHMLLFYTLCDPIQVMLIHNQVQSLASIAHPFYCGDQEFPWLHFFRIYISRLNRSRSVEDGSVNRFSTRRQTEFRESKTSLTSSNAELNVWAATTHIMPNRDGNEQRVINRNHSYSSSLTSLPAEVNNEIAETIPRSAFF